MHCKPDRQIPLVGRSKILDDIHGAWSERAGSGGACDRMLFPLPVIVGVPGSGKTRLLEEWKIVSRTMNIPDSNSLGILVPYDNDHGVREIEIHHSIERTFVWRFLHRYFLEDTVDFTKFVDAEAPKLPRISLCGAVTLVCDHVRQRVGFVATERISIFIGIDEFQTIPNNNSELGVPRLIALIVDATIQLQRWGIDVYTMFAGTEWGKVQSGWPSYPCIKKICVPFFDLEQKLEIAAHIHPKGCRSEAFVENLHRIGDIAHCAVEYCNVRSAM